MQDNLLYPKSENLNILISYACVMVSARNVTVIRTWAPCLSMKNDVAHGLSILKSTQYVT